MNENARQDLPSQQPSGGPEVPQEDPFFASIRRSGWFRAEPRWIAGVCSGISRRTGWDARLIRGLMIVATLVLWIPVVLYGVAWFLLPNGPRGQIEAQDALRGDFDWSQLWAGLFVIVGLTVLPSSFFWGLPMVLVWWLLVIASVIALIIYFSSNKRAASGMGGAERGVPMSAPNGGSYGQNSPQAQLQGGPNLNPPAPGSQRTYQQGTHQPGPIPPPGSYQKYYVPAAVQKPPAISNLVGFLTVGALFLIAAGGVIAMFQANQPVPVVLGTIGLIVLITGAVLAWAALTGRRGGWFLGFSIAGALLLLPVTAVGVGVAANLNYVLPAVDDSAWVEEFEGSEDWADPYEETGNANVANGFAWYQSDTDMVSAYSSQVVWDLTEAQENGWYTLDASESQVTVLVTADRVPIMSAWEAHGAINITARSEDATLNQKHLDRWVESGFTEGPLVSSNDQEIHLSMTLESSQVTFIFLSEEQAELLRTRVGATPDGSLWSISEDEGADVEASETAQSGAEAPQSGN